MSNRVPGQSARRPFRILSLDGGGHSAIALLGAIAVFLVVWSIAGPVHAQALDRAECRITCLSGSKTTEVGSFSDFLTQCADATEVTVAPRNSNAGEQCTIGYPISLVGVERSVVVRLTDVQFLEPVEIVRSRLTALLVVGSTFESGVDVSNSTFDTSVELRPHRVFEYPAWDECTP